MVIEMNEKKEESKTEEIEELREVRVFDTGGSGENKGHAKRACIGNGIIS